MEFLLVLLSSLLKAIVGETFDQLRREDTVEDSEPILDSIEIAEDPDDLSGLDIFDELLNEDNDGLRSSDSFA